MLHSALWMALRSLVLPSGAVIFEQLAYGDVSTAAYLTIHNMVRTQQRRARSSSSSSSWLPQRPAADGSSLCISRTHAVTHSISALKHQRTTHHHHCQVAYVISKFGSPALQASLLPRLTAMDSLASYCLTEPGSGSDAASLTTSATPVEGGWLLQGSKAFISGAGASDVYLVRRDEPCLCLMLLCL